MIDIVERLREGLYGVCNEVEIDKQMDIVADEIERLRAENERLREALKCLVDEQNGPPLLQREHYWREAMDMAGAALNLSRHK